MAGPVNAGSLLIASANRFAEQPALWVDQRSFCYREVLSEVSRLARALADQPGTVCAILGERSLTAYCAPLACLLSGKTFVPLGVSFPVSRMSSMIERSGASLLIADASSSDKLNELLPQLSRPLLLMLPEGPQTIETPEPHAIVELSSIPVDPIDRALATTEPAYVLFTSGSSGQPKGVAVGHGALLAYVGSILQRYPEITAGERCSQLFEPTFDLALHDLFVSWAAGACLYAVPRRELMAPIDFINRHEVSVWFSVPSLLSALQRFRLLRPRVLPSLKLALFCGEALPREAALQWLDAAPNARSENLYGPTESTIACSAFRFDGDPGESTVVPIGSAFPGVEMAVVDADNCECATGVVGELFLGGTQLAQGYWRDETLTGERFPQLALPGRRSHRWYRTGDLACADAAGQLHFKGRADRQVKVRGYRVELQEVEAALREACTSSAVAVLPQPAPPGESIPGLLAWVVAQNNDSASRLMAACRSRLPAYMVPSAIHLVDELPLNSNGKTDYAALAKTLERGVSAPNPRHRQRVQA